MFDDPITSVAVVNQQQIEENQKLQDKLQNRHSKYHQLYSGGGPGGSGGSAGTRHSSMHSASSLPILPSSSGSLLTPCKATFGDDVKRIVEESISLSVEQEKEKRVGNSIFDNNQGNEEALHHANNLFASSSTGSGSSDDDNKNHNDININHKHTLNKNSTGLGLFSTASISEPTLSNTNVADSPTSNAKTTGSELASNNDVGNGNDVTGAYDNSHFTEHLSSPTTVKTTGAWANKDNASSLVATATHNLDNSATLGVFALGGSQFDNTPNLNQSPTHVVSSHIVDPNTPVSVIDHHSTHSPLNSNSAASSILQHSDHEEAHQYGIHGTHDSNDTNDVYLTNSSYPTLIVSNKKGGVILLPKRPKNVHNHSSSRVSDKKGHVTAGSGNGRLAQALHSNKNSSTTAATTHAGAYTNSESYFPNQPSCGAPRGLGSKGNASSRNKALSASASGTLQQPQASATATSLPSSSQDVEEECDEERERKERHHDAVGAGSNTGELFPGSSPRSSENNKNILTSNPDDKEDISKDNNEGASKAKQYLSSSPSATSSSAIPNNASKIRQAEIKQRKQQEMITRQNLLASKLLSSYTAVVPQVNVLIVEDNIINKRILERYLRQRSIRSDWAENGRKAIEKWRQGGFHLVLMDIQMPELSGLEATKEIRRLEQVNRIGVFSTDERGSASSSASSASSSAAALLSVSSSTDLASSANNQKDSINDTSSKCGKGVIAPEDVLDTKVFKFPVIIVALTASSALSDKTEALAAGCNDYLVKPVNLKWLWRKTIEWGCMQALIDFEGWKHWVSKAPPSISTTATGNNVSAASGLNGNSLSSVGGAGGHNVSGVGKSSVEARNPAIGIGNALTKSKENLTKEAAHTTQSSSSELSSSYNASGSEIIGKKEGLFKSRALPLPITENAHEDILIPSQSPSSVHDPSAAGLLDIQAFSSFPMETSPPALTEVPLSMMMSPSEASISMSHSLSSGDKPTQHNQSMSLLARQLQKQKNFESGRNEHNDDGVNMVNKNGLVKSKSFVASSVSSNLSMLSTRVKRATSFTRKQSSDLSSLLRISRLSDDNNQKPKKSK